MSNGQLQASAQRFQEWDTKVGPAMVALMVHADLSSGISRNCGAVEQQRNLTPHNDHHRRTHGHNMLTLTPVSVKFPKDVLAYLRP